MKKIEQSKLKMNCFWIKSCRWLITTIFKKSHTIEKNNERHFRDICIVRMHEFELFLNQIVSLIRFKNFLEITSNRKMIIDRHRSLTTAKMIFNTLNENKYEIFDTIVRFDRSTSFHVTKIRRKRISWQNYDDHETNWKLIFRFISFDVKWRTCSFHLLRWWSFSSRFVDSSKMLFSNMKIKKIELVFFVLICFEIEFVLFHQTLSTKKWHLRSIKIKIVLFVIFFVLEIIHLTFQISSKEKISKKVVWMIVYCTISLSFFVKIITKFKSNFSKINFYQIAHWFRFIFHDWRRQIDFKSSQQQFNTSIVDQSQLNTSIVDFSKNIWKKFMKFIVVFNWREIHAISLLMLIKIDVVVW